jgi:hypothetical protein
LNESEDAELRIAALGVLADFGPEAKAAVNDLAKLLERNSHSFEMTNAICHALGEMRSGAGPAASVLFSLCNNPNTMFRLEAARTLGKIGPLTADQVRLLVRVLEKEQETLTKVCSGLIDSRGRMLARPDRERPDGEIADDEERCVRVQMEMVYALEKLQRQLSWEDARSIVMPALITVLKYPHTSRIAAHWHELHNGCFCTQCHLYIAAAKALRYYGSDAKDALPALESLLKYESPRDQIKRTIKEIQIQPSCYLDPWVLSAIEGQAKTKLVVKREEMVADDGQHIIVVLKIRKNIRTREEIARIFPNAGEGWVKMGDEIDWGKPEDQPIAERVAKIPAEKHGDTWVAYLTIPRIEHSTFHVWDTTWHDYSGHVHDVRLVWSSQK